MARPSGAGRAGPTDGELPEQSQGAGSAPALSAAPPGGGAAGAAQQVEAAAAGNPQAGHVAEEGHPEHTVGTIGTLQLALEDDDLLRGVAPPNLRGFGRHFRAKALADRSFSVAEAARLFAHSRKVRQLHEFLSHSWRDSALAKFLALCLYYNSLPALVVAALVATLVCLLQVLNLLPSWNLYTFEHQQGEVEVVERGSWCFVVGCLVFSISLASWQHAPSWLGGGQERAVFFDKLCVHQADEERKAAGIRSFAAFIAKANCFLVLWSPNYFRRLWCTLEVAAFVHIQHGLHGTYEHRLKTNLAFIPLQLASLTVYCFTLAVLFLLLNAVLRVAKSQTGLSQGLADLIGTSLMLVIVPFGMHLFRAYARGRQALVDQLQGFDVQTAACFDENDRTLVYNTIREWFGTLELFNKHVRTTVANYVLSTIPDRANFPLSFTVGCVCPPFFFSTLDEFARNTKFSTAALGVHISLTNLTTPIIIDLLLSSTLRVASLAFVSRKRDSLPADAAVSLAAAAVALFPTFALDTVTLQVVHPMGHPFMALWIGLLLVLWALARGQLQRFRAWCARPRRG